MKKLVDIFKAPAYQLDEPQNKFLVLPHGKDSIIVHKLPAHPMSKEDAVDLAAHLVHFAGSKYHAAELEHGHLPLTRLLLRLKQIRRQNL